jgi:rhodanese-related sulfurtransferase
VGSSDGFIIEDVSVVDAWRKLASDSSSILVDVRTRAEWAYVGLPDLSGIGKQPVLAEWQDFPTNVVDPRFAEKLTAALDAAGVSRDAELLFICRSGGRSKMAALAMAERGYSRSRNVADGFEGPLDAHRHRSTSGGWKKAGLPWVQG